MVLLRLIVLVIAVMVKVSAAALDEACYRFSDGLQKFGGEPNSSGMYTCQACVTCDRLLHWYDDQSVSCKSLKSRRSHFLVNGEDELHDDLQSYYTYAGKGAESWMENMLLSPRAVWLRDIDLAGLGNAKPGFRCCTECANSFESSTHERGRFDLPEYSIANGYCIGEAPELLQCLYPAELSLVAMARIDKHVFTFYGGCHKSLKGWHNMYEADIEHVAGSLLQLKEFGIGSHVACLLMGPFTSKQRKKAKDQCTIRPKKVLAAMKWLIENNPLYKDCRLPTEAKLPKPLIIDHSETVPGSNSAEEGKFEYQVVFPELDDVRETNGGYVNQDEFKEKVIDDLDATNDATLISRPTTNRLRDYEGSNFMKCFPLQFPYGVGRKQESSKKKTSEKRKGYSDNEIRYLQHLLSLSLPNMHRAEFGVVVHNMYERHRAVGVSFLRCKHQSSGTSRAESFADINVEQLRSAINRSNAGMSVADRSSYQFLNSIEAVSRNMAHTNEAAKQARRRMFAMIAKFGVPAVFFTVTPNDSGSFRIKVNALKETEAPPNVDACSDDIEVDSSVAALLREKYPGLCAFDFENILGLIIEHLIGWDDTKGIPHKDGGVFGIPEAWSAAVEEQGRKTLHVHFLLWIKEWGDLLKRLRSNDKTGVREAAGKELEEYVDSIMSTKLHGNLPGEGRRKAFSHECQDDGISAQLEKSVVWCTKQDLRNLRYREGTTSFGDTSIAKCSTCNKTFTSEDFVANVMNGYYPSDDAASLDRRMALGAKRIGAGLDLPTTCPDFMGSFMINASENLHRTTHALSCFKKGPECRFLNPMPPCDETITVFDVNNQARWAAWSGECHERDTFQVIMKRDPLDVFVNTHHPATSRLIGCNTNVQCGIDGGHIFYCTTYQTKSTQAEDSRKYATVAKMMTDRIRRYEQSIENVAESANDCNAVDIPPPFTEGYRRLLGSVLVHTGDHVVSAPLGRYIVMNGSRFKYSHEFGEVPLSAFLDKPFAKRVKAMGDSTYFEDQMKNYMYRPNVLEDYDLIDFVSMYEVRRMSSMEKKEGDALRFSSRDHPNYEIEGVFERDNPVVPMLSFQDFPDASKFGGRDLLDNVGVPPEHFCAMNEYAKSALFLLKPFRDKDDLVDGNDETHLSLFRNSFFNNEFAAHKLEILQNTQDCYNMLRAGRLDDELTRTTVPVAENGRVDYEKQEEDREAEKYVREVMTETVAFLEEPTGTDNNVDPTTSMSLEYLCANGTGRIASDGMIKDVDCNEADCVYKLDAAFANRTDNGGNDEVLSGTPPKVTKEALVELSLKSIRRQGGSSNLQSVTDIEPNGTPESIKKWAELAFTSPRTGVLDEDQKRAFEVIVCSFIQTYWHDATIHDKTIMPTERTRNPTKRHRTISLQQELRELGGMGNEKQLLLFLTGAGGSGKSEVINNVRRYSKGFCKQLGQPFNSRTIVVTAMTGVAATAIHGETLASAAHLQQTRPITAEQIKAWENARLVIIDEISFANSSNLRKLHRQLCCLKERPSQRYGGISIIFAGDFRQLMPVQGKSLYEDESVAMWHDWINCFLELQGNHRFGDDPKYGEANKRFRDGTLTAADFEYLNERVMNRQRTDGSWSNPGGPTMEDVPSDTAYATPTNRDRCAINDNIFSKHICNSHSTDQSVPPPKHTIIVRSDEVFYRVKRELTPLAAPAKVKLWTQCPDYKVTDGSGRKGSDAKKYRDVCLKLHSNIPLMLTDNTDVENQKANGTVCFLEHVKFKPGVSEDDIDVINVDGYWVRSIVASKVKNLVCRFENSSKTFEVDAASTNCVVQYPMELLPGRIVERQVNMRANVFPLLVNHATTGHKLQGKTKKRLLVSSWSYQRNWPYVAISRVRTHDGLFLREPLDPTKDYSFDSRLERMMKKMRTKAPLDP